LALPLAGALALLAAAAFLAIGLFRGAEPQATRTATFALG
jgi:hypothetical protein